MNRIARNAALVLLGIASAVQAQSSGIDIARRYRQAHEAEILSDFARLLAMPNLSSDSLNIRANANYLADALRALGLKAELWTAPGGAPAVYGELIVPGATRTLGIYAHYDGQPTGDLSTWANPPWQPTLYTKAIDGVASASRCRKRVSASIPSGACTRARRVMTRRRSSRCSPR
jgi:hypothetical protein